LKGKKKSLVWENVPLVPTYSQFHTNYDYRGGLLINKDFSHGSSML